MMKTVLTLFIIIIIAFSLSAQENKLPEKRSINSSNTKSHNQALIIVDGIKFSRQDSVNILDSIKPENIERMDVIKGEGATLQYGEEGKDGVIVIVTKTPEKKELPLYLVDGVKTKNITDLDPNDIESIHVLKGKASTSQYGDEAEAGVILITTKKSKKQSKN